MHFRANYLTPESANLSVDQLGPQKQPHAEVALELFKMKTNDPSLKNFGENLFIDQSNLRANVLEWLSKLTTSNEFKHEKFGPLFATRILGILQLAQNNADYCDILQATLTESLDTCCDRAILAVNYLEVQKRIIESKDGSLENLLTILKGSFALNKLKYCSQAFVNSHPTADEIEVYLGFQVELKEALGLPISLNTMNYYSCSGIENKHLVKAKQTVADALNSQELVDYLISDKTWTDRLKQEFRVDFETALKSTYDELEELSQNEKLTSQQLQDGVKALQIQKEKIEKKFIFEKTLSLLETGPTVPQQATLSVCNRLNYPSF
jgi:hypothetical protein